MSKDSNNIDLGADRAEAPSKVSAPPAAVKLPAAIPPASERREQTALAQTRPAAARLLPPRSARATGGFTRPPVCRRASPSATAGSKPTRSTSTPNSPAASRSCSADEGDMVKAGQVVALHGHARSRRHRCRRPRRRSRRRSARSTRRRPIVRAAKDPGDCSPAGNRPRPVPGAEGLYARRRRSISASSNWMAPIAALNAADARVGQAEHALDAATHDVELYQVNIADNTLVAPRDGRIQYRVANIGEVLPAGGKVFTMLDIGLCLHGHLSADARRPAGSRSAPTRASCSTPIRTRPIPAKVTFIATQAQFTPKTVETKDERDKLMFRDPGADRSRAAARACRRGAQRPAGRRLCAHRSRGRLAAAAASGRRRNDRRAARCGRASRGVTPALRQASSRSTTSRSTFRPAAWSG